MNDQQIRVWRSLSTRSRRAMRRTKDRRGWTVNYRPKGDLLLRIMQDENISKTEAYNLLQGIRKIVVRDNW